jgi:hypothetical protein
MKVTALTIIILACQFCYAQSDIVRIALQKNIVFYDLSRFYKFRDGFDKNYNLVKSSKDCEWFDLMPNKNFDLELQKTNIDLQYPDSEFILIGFYKPHYEFHDSITKLNYQINSHIFELFDQLYLVAYDPLKKEIKFLSGNIFKHKIWNDFKNKGENNIQNILNFIKIKCYNLNISSISYKHKSGNKYFFNAVLNGLGSNYRITFNSKEPDCLVVKKMED